MNDKQKIEILREALMQCVVMESSQMRKPCWCRTIAGLYCVGQEQCNKATEALEKTKDD